MQQKRNLKNKYNLHILFNDYIILEEKIVFVLNSSDYNGICNVISEENIMKLDSRPGLVLAKEKAKELLDKSHWDNTPVDASFIAKKNGIKVKNCSFEDNNISGYYDFEEKTIYVNSNEFVKRQQFTIAHELGHATFISFIPRK